MKFTAIACENIDLIKSWGYKNEDLLLPINSTISANLSSLLTVVTVEFSDNFTHDQVYVDGQVHPAKEHDFLTQLERIRTLAGIKQRAMVAGQKNYRTNSLSLSDSFVAALSLAGSKAAGLELDEKGLGILAKQGKNSSCRSIPEGFNQWKDGNSIETSYCQTIFNKQHWDLGVVSVIVNDQNQEYKPEIGIEASKYYPTRLVDLPKKIKVLTKAIKERNFDDFGAIIEQEAMDLVAIKLTSYPTFIDLEPDFINLIRFFSTKQNFSFKTFFSFTSDGLFHIFCPKENTLEIQNKISNLGYNNIFIGGIGDKTTKFEKDLF